MTWLFVHAAATWFMVGLIWTIQTVHYPLFARVGAADFVGYENEHTTRMARLLAVPAGLEIVTGAALVWTRPGEVSLWLVMVAGALLVAIWVTTAVRGPDGRPGVWFDSLDITRLIPVLVALGTYRLPYRWADMSIEHQSDTVVYQAKRRWPGPRGATSTIAARPGAPIIPTDREHFLTARWGLYSIFGRGIAYAPVDHPPWPLQAATLLDLDDRLIGAAGYPPPAGAPLVHYSPGVDVRIGLPRKVG